MITISVERKTLLIRIVDSSTPLERAPITYGFSSSSSTTARICRVYFAPIEIVNVSAGMITARQSLPIIGNKFNCNARK